MRKSEAILAAGAVATFFCAATPSFADYETSPDLRPSVRCAGLANPADCQPLFWDLPAATHEGFVATAAPLDAFPDFPGGMTDRPPPLYTDGTEGYERPGAGRTPLCPLAGSPTVADPDRVPYWKAIGDGKFQVVCQRGSRAYYGPYSMGQDPENYDLLAYKVLRFENSGRLTADQAGQYVAAERHELNVGSETYGHVGSHHGTCYVSNDRCADPNEAAYASSSQCDAFREIASQCPAEGESTECLSAQGTHGFVAFRSTTARQGRFATELPPGKAFGVTEDPMWMCQQHLVAEEPAGTGGSYVRRNFRNQAGGTVGELVVQLLTVPWATAGFTPVSMTFDFVASAATTIVPPFTVAPQDTVWYAPFDLAIGMITLHSHENMVQGTIDVPGMLPRVGSTRAACGGGVGAAHAYESYSYFAPEVCEYWRDADGPIIVRKGQAIHASCIVNNGMTPTQAVPDPQIRGALEASPVGQALYGQQPPAAYRVRYGCEEIKGVPPGSPPNNPARDCPPNPQANATGGLVDGPYDAPEYCIAGTGRCAPANVVFANTGEDSMCIPILMYWPLERVLNSDGSVNQAAVDKAAAGDVNEVGTPGRVWKSPSDGGTCNDGASADGTNVQQPAQVGTPSGRHCSAGL